MNNISLYKEQFSNLNVNIAKGKKAPNKSILLLSVMDLIRCNYISSNKIYIDSTIKETFEINWKRYVGTTPVPTVWTPFWHFKPIKSQEDIDNLAASCSTAPVGKMQLAIQYAYLDNELFELLNDEEGREELASVLVETYLKV